MASSQPNAFLDANVIRGQLTTDIMMSLAYERLFRPQWSEHVMDEARRNRPPGITEAAINSRFAQMNKVFPTAMTSGYEPLMPEMQADEKDKHVLAAAVHGRSHILVTENVKDFDPPTSGPNALQVERTSAFLNRLLSEDPARVVAAMNKLVTRNRHDPRTMPDLIDKMATQQDLRGFARHLNAAVPPDQRGTHPNLTITQSAKVALDGIAPPTSTTAKPTPTPDAHKSAQAETKRADRSSRPWTTSRADHRSFSRTRPLRRRLSSRNSLRKGWR
jgi:hypothetical protein